jgi:hypothetical protein
MRSTLTASFSASTRLWFHKSKTTDSTAKPTRYYKDQTKTDEQVSQIASRMRNKLFEMSRMSGRDGIDDVFGCARRAASSEWRLILLRAIGDEEYSHPVECYLHMFER